MKNLKVSSFLFGSWLALCGFIPQPGRHISDSGNEVALTLGANYAGADTRHEIPPGNHNTAYRHFALNVDTQFGKIAGPLQFGLNLSSFWYLSTLDFYYSAYGTDSSWFNLGVGTDLGFIQAPYFLGTINFGPVYLSLKPRLVIYALGSNWGNGFDESGLYAFNWSLGFGTKKLFNHWELSFLFSMTKYFGPGFEWFNYRDIFGQKFFNADFRARMKDGGVLEGAIGYRF